MGKTRVKGKLEYTRWEKGVVLTPKQAILAQCYHCMGEFDGGKQDCGGEKTCPLYKYYPYQGVTQ